MKISISADHDRFPGDGQKYATRHNTPERRLRLELALANLRGFLPPLPAKRALPALHLGARFEFAGVARYMQSLARPPHSSTRNRA
jgi:hypothetical protein